MRLTVHIFRKDIRRLWWEVIIATAAVAVLARMDSQRADYIAGPLESMFNLLVPAIWAYLIVLLIHEEPLVGETQFWITRPYPRRALLGAKLLFVLAFIHLPSFTADAMILSARGFQPWRYAPQLLCEQSIVAVVVTLPALALASVTRNLAQFASAAAAIVISSALLAGSFGPLSAPWIDPDKARFAIALAPLAVAAGGMILLQYSGRRTALARTAGILAVVAAAALFVYLPRETAFAMQCAWERTPADLRAMSIAVTHSRESPPHIYLPRRTGEVSVAIPIAISGVPEAARIHVRQLELVVSCPSGLLRQTVTASRARIPPPFTIFLNDKQTGWQMMTLDPSTLRDERCTITGKVAVSAYLESQPGVLPVGATGREIAGLGRCSSFTIADYGGREMLKAVCESPSELAGPVGVKLVGADRASEWRQRLGDSLPFVPYIRTTWLSPVHRRQTFFHIVDERPTHEGSRWLVPRDDLRGASLIVTPEHLIACSVLRYELRDLDLREFVVRSGRK